MSQADKVGLGLDFGTESVRAVLVGLAGGERGGAVVKYPHGQLVECLPSREALPPDFALQHPEDWLPSAGKAVRRALAQAGLKADAVVGVGVDFTSCTMLPARADGTPLCLLPDFAAEPHAWPKLWKHHAAKKQTARMNAVARAREEPFLKRYGGIIGLEWFFPKVLEAIEEAPPVAAAAEVWLEAGDWLVWQLVGGPAAALPRSTCQAGYKGLWSAADGYPPQDYLRAVHPRLAEAAAKRMPGRMVSPGRAAGALTREAAKVLGLRPETPVSAAVIDAHAAVPGVGAAEAGALVLVLGTSACHMINATQEKFVPGVAGVVKDGILPGMFGYETGQAAVGDAFDWVRRLVGAKDFTGLEAAAAAAGPGAGGVRGLDWLNGCRTPLMDGALTGAFTGLGLRHGPGHLYRALLEASACGLRWIVELLRDHGVPIRRCVATGGLATGSPLFVQIIADVLGQAVQVHPSGQGSARGAAILGAMAARGPGASAPALIRAMAGGDGPEPAVVSPDRAARETYQSVYLQYRRLADQFSTPARSNP